MPITLFYDFVVTFADATTTEVSDGGHIDRVYRILEAPQHRWTITENDQPVAMTDEQHGQLVHLLAALQPPPDPTIEPTPPGWDGTWLSLVIRRGDQQTGYQWWVDPPSNWAVLGAITAYVEQLANIPRKQVAEQQRQVTRQFFDRLAARNLPGLLAQYHPDIHYRNPFFELHGAEVAAMWRMWWDYLPDVQVVCKDSGINSDGAYWHAIYTYSPTGRRVEHHISADLMFSDGAIIQHVDRFNVHEWANNAYGFVGRMIGGWRLFEWRIAMQARTRLAAFLREQQSEA